MKVGLNGNHDWTEVLPGAIDQDATTLGEVVADRAVRKSDLPIDGVTALFNVATPDKERRLSGSIRLHGGVVGRFILEEVAA